MRHATSLRSPGRAGPNTGGSLTQGGFTFTFTKGSVTGARQNGPYTPADINVEPVPGGLRFVPNPMLDLKTTQGGQSLMQLSMN